MRGPEVLGAAMSFYELLGLGQNRDLNDPDRRIPRFEALSRRQVLALEPDVPERGLSGGVRFHEGHMTNSERTTLAVIRSAVTAGATVANYVEAVGLLESAGHVAGLKVRDVHAAGEGGGEIEVRARVVANMTGPWAPQVDSRFGRPSAQRFGLSKGVHIVTRPLTRSGALALATHHQTEAKVSRGGRHFFIIPWREHSLIGTTNVPFAGDPAQVGVTETDIADFVDDINGAYPAAALRRKDVRFFYGGLYPLVDKEVRAGVYQGAGEVEIRDHGREGMPGLITVIGAKYTTARNLARQAIDRVFMSLGQPSPPVRTASTPVDGGRIDRIAEFVAGAVHEDQRGLQLGEEVMRDLVAGYGTEYPAVLAEVRANPELGKRVAKERPTIGAVVRYAVREEMALHLADVVFRRTGLGTIGHPGEESLVTCAGIMAGELGWSAAERDEEIEGVRAAFRTFG
jgi:glycerol-3-phosphate dehydrogenase